MSNLSIYFTEKKPFYYNEFLCEEGIITFDNFSEKFYASIEYWKKEDYENQWQQAIARLKNHSKTCLITEINNPMNGHFIEWWTIYKRNKKLFIQNQFLFGKIYKKFIGNKLINSNNCYDFIPSFNPKSKSKAAVWIIELPEELKKQNTSYQTGTYKIKKHRSIWAL